MSANPAIAWNQDVAEFAILLAAASPELRREIIRELYRVCDRAGMPPRGEVRS